MIHNNTKNDQNPKFIFNVDGKFGYVTLQKPKQICGIITTMSNNLPPITLTKACYNNMLLAETIVLN